MHNAFDPPQQQSLPPPDPRVVLRQAVRTWKNVFLLVLLAIALICLVAGLNCDAATDAAPSLLYNACPAGYYCPEATPYPLPCPAGTHESDRRVRARVERAVVGERDDVHLIVRRQHERLDRIVVGADSRPEVGGVGAVAEAVGAALEAVEAADGQLRKEQGRGRRGRGRRRAAEGAQGGGGRRVAKSAQVGGERPLVDRRRRLARRVAPRD